LLLQSDAHLSILAMDAELSQLLDTVYNLYTLRDLMLDNVVRFFFLKTNVEER